KKKRKNRQVNIKYNNRSGRGDTLQANLLLCLLCVVNEADDARGDYARDDERGLRGAGHFVISSFLFQSFKVPVQAFVGVFFWKEGSVRRGTNDASVVFWSFRRLEIP